MIDLIIIIMAGCRCIIPMPADGSDGLGRRKVICAVQHNLFIEADSEKLKPMTSRQFVGKWKGVKFQ